MFKKSFIIIILLSLFSLPTLAQEVELEIVAEDLEISEPGSFSWLQNIFGDIQIFFTRDPIKKSELELKKASRLLIKARKLVREDPNDTKLQTRLEKLDGKYQGLVERINARIENFKAEDADSPKLKNFLDKYTNHQLKHQVILKRLEEKVPEKVFEIIKANREEHLQRFGEVMDQLQNREEFKERLGEILGDNQQRVENRIRQMEILEELEQVAPVVKERINEMRQEKEELFQELEIKRQEIRGIR